jgi:hypothetical protein
MGWYRRNTLYLYSGSALFDFRTGAGFVTDTFQYIPQDLQVSVSVYRELRPDCRTLVGLSMLKESHAVNFYNKYLLLLE